MPPVIIVPRNINLSIYLSPITVAPTAR